MDPGVRSTKVIKVFKFFDKDNSNFIDRNDFKISAQYIALQRGWQPGEARYKDVENSMLKVWESLEKYADTDSDGKVSLVEWLEMWDKFANNSPLEWQSLYCKLIFDLQDVTGDGVIDVDEYSTCLHSLGVDKEKAIHSFECMARGKPTISWEEFQELWEEFFTSDDPDAPGNHMFGPKKACCLTHTCKVSGHDG